MLKSMITKECISLNLTAKSKNDVIDELVNMLFENGKLNDPKEYKAQILKREEESSTGLEEGIAIPHAKTAAVKVPTVAIGISKDGVDFNSLDGEPSKLFFMIAAPANAKDSHIEVLSQLSTSLLDDDIREGVLNAKSKEEIINILLKSEDNKEVIDEGNNFDVLAVTACPTGIAHTYMAADALRKKASELGVKIKVETNGSTGVKNKLTDEDIKNAKGIVVAADTNIEMARFNGKHVVIVPVTEGIKNPEKLITEATNNVAPIYTADDKEIAAAGKKEKTGFYKHLMSGVSNMLPFVVGGGILIAISFMFGIKAFDPNDATFNPIAKLLMDIGGGNAFFLMIPVLAGFIGFSIADRPGFAPAMVAGLISANNGAGFLGALIGGFIGGYSIILLKKVFGKLPESLEGIKPVLLYPLFGIFITGTIMYTVILGPVAALNNGMTSMLQNMGTGNLVLLGVVLAGMMAVDMGGPVNKAAFTFGIAMISAGNYYPHAAVMAGGMVPPLGIAIATTVFKNKFTKEEKDAGKTCYIMGASFITEGAIPFAASDPARVIPSCIIGSAIAGGISMFGKVQLPAPHGGIFVIPVMTNPIMYIVAVLVGSFITAALIGFLKPVK
ncbi:fructose-specific PTS transporter subunit EIIC [Fusobacterium sp. IOR10]|uniref:PTS fructose transporter subunit IIABC n=1 Tax=Fusobacterium sp. IOR10 TaxID=2665157 RepID=UPI0013D52EC0|nr:fructose-specific PTS transporter subunit EIIC [Fusobacterium sp. IOR10]